MKYVIFDIDGTIADCDHRMHWIKREKKDYERFYADCILDEPIPDTLEMVMHLFRSGFEIVFCTGRSETVRSLTEAWLKEHLPGIYFDLYMRREKDYRSDTQVKPELLGENELTPSKVFGIFDDRKRVTKAFRDLGYRVYQVTEGDY